MLSHLQFFNWIHINTVRLVYTEAYKLLQYSWWLFIISMNRISIGWTFQDRMPYKDKGQDVYGQWHKIIDIPVVIEDGSDILGANINLWKSRRGSFSHLQSNNISVFVGGVEGRVQNSQRRNGRHGHPSLGHPLPLANPSASIDETWKTYKDRLLSPHLAHYWKDRIGRDPALSRAAPAYNMDLRRVPAQLVSRYVYGRDEDGEHCLLGLSFPFPFSTA